jgi:hypothetical protein
LNSAAERRRNTAWGFNPTYDHHENLFKLRRSAGLTARLIDKLLDGSIGKPFVYAISWVSYPDEPRESCALNRAEYPPPGTFPGVENPRLYTCAALRLRQHGFLHFLSMRFFDHRVTQPRGLIPVPLTKTTTTHTITKNCRPTQTNATGHKTPDPGNYITTRITQSQLESYLWGACRVKAGAA